MSSQIVLRKYLETLRVALDILQNYGFKMRRDCKTLASLEKHCWWTVECQPQQQPRLAMVHSSTSFVYHNEWMFSFIWFIFWIYIIIFLRGSI